jgi:hypothetical protein
MTRDDDASKDAYNAKAAERMRKWRAANPLSPEQKVKAAARSRKWRQSNKEHNSVYQKAYRAANREKLNAQQLIYKARRKRAAALQKPDVI